MTEKPIPILFTIPNFITAGSGRVMFNILTRLDKERFSPSVCVSRKGGAIEQELDNLGIPVLELPFKVDAKPNANLLLRARERSKAFRPYGFKIWHSFNYSSDYTEALIAYMAGAKAWVYTKKNMMWGARAWLMRSYLASCIVADNEDMPLCFFNRWGLRSKVRIIHHGLDIYHFTPLSPSESNYRKKLRISTDSPIITCVAQLVPVKDHPTLLRAMAEVPEARLLLAGSTTDAVYLHKLDALSGELGIADRVHFLGTVSDIPALLAESDVFVLPTTGRGEGCPVALLEAMACGKACVATDIPGSRDLIIPGESGIIIPPSNPEKLADALTTLINSPELRLKYGQNARKRAEEHFSIEREVRLHEEMYAELLGWND